MRKIHPTAVVDPAAELAEGVEIGPYVVVGPHVRIGENSIVRGQATLAGWTEIGSRVEIYPFVSVGMEPQDLKYKGEKTLLKIGDGTVIRESVTLHPGTAGGGSVTMVGADCFLMVGVHVAHDCHLGQGVIMANGTHLGGHVTIEDGAILGALCGVHQYVRIGTLGMTAAGSMVGQDVPPYCTVHGDHARLVGLNLVGLRRSGMSSAQIATLKKAYQILFRSKTLFKDRLARVERELAGSPEVDRMIKFIRDSKRGLCR